MTTGSRGFFESEDAYVRRAADAALQAASSTDARLLRLFKAADARIDALAARVEGLSRAFDAHVEAAEVRREAEQYGAAAAVRAFARGNIRVLADPGRAVPSVDDVVDVPGYWLAPAVVGVAGLLGSGAQEDAKERLAEASRRDAYRTAVFVVSLLGLREAGAAAEPWLAAALPPAVATAGDTAQVTVAERCLWLAYAAGVYGPSGRAVLSEWLGALATAVEPADLERAFGAFGGRPGRSVASVGSPRSRSIRSQAIENALHAAAAAGDSLAVVLDVLNGELRPADGTASTWSAAEPGIEALLAALIEEGSPPEVELIRRAAELEALARRSVETDTATSQPARWDANVGAAADFLLADLTDAGGSAAARRETALTALARPLAAFAESLLDRAAAVPTTIAVPILWRGPVTLDRSVPFDQALAAVHVDIERDGEAEIAGAGRKQAAAIRRRVEEQKQAATERLRDAAELLSAYHARGEEILAAAKVPYSGVMGLLGSRAERNGGEN